MTDTLNRPAQGFGEGPVPPQALEAERAVLSAMLLAPEAVGRAIEKLDASVFYRAAHARVFDACVALYNRNEKADLVTAVEELRKRGDLEAVGGPAFVASLVESATTTVNLEEHMRIVASKAVLRSLIRASHDIQQECFAASDETQNILDRAEQKVFAITDARIRQGFSPIKELLKNTFKHIQELYERKAYVTGVPSGYDDLDKLTAGFQSGDLIIIAGRPSMGKCLSARMRVEDPDTGERLTIEECVRRRQKHVMGVSEEGRVRAAAISHWVDSGHKPTFRVRTRTGREVEVTGHHPFLTVNGWRPLHDLKAGDHVGVPRRLPVFGRDDSWSLERVRLLAYFIAEGGLTSGCSHFTNADPEIVADFERCLASEFPACGMRLQDARGITWRVSRRSTWPDAVQDRLNPVTDWLDRLGLMGKKSDAKRLPDLLWRWDRPRLAEFLRALFSCDGTIYPMGGYPRIEFTVASEALAADVHHALCRMGILAKRWRKTERSWRVEITEPESVEVYQREIGWIGEKTSRFPIDGMAAQGPRSRRSNVGHAPVETWALVETAAGAQGLTLSEVARRAGEDVKRGYNLHRQRGISRHRLAAFAQVLASPQLSRVASGDIYWDEIVAIESAGVQQVYDLSVPDGANFVAEDVCVHNTSLAVNMAENAAIRHKIPIAIFSIEMSKEQLAFRLLCSQSEVALQKLRSGYLGQEDWPRLTTGAGLLNQAPIMIDDSAAPTVLEIRAKCRRLRAEGKLGLVLIDYLQLVRPSGRSENRVQEISEVTRSLKALAKELQVPVVALSQLSRAVDSRTGGDRRPQLSDLRESGCLTADSRVLRADTGAEVTMGELLATGERNIPVWSLDDDLRTVSATMSHVFPSGTKPVFRLELTSGREVRASANHPFLTLDGWRRLDQLTVGVRLASLGVAAGPETSIQPLRIRPLKHSLPERSVALLENSAPCPMLAWDTVAAIEPDGEEAVFDATVEGTHNFIANGIVVHNSIEQDADVVMFVFREEYYKRDDPTLKGKAELIVAKQRNGPTGDVRMTFLHEYTKFVPGSDLMPGETESGF